MKNTRHNALKALASRLTAAMCLCVSLLLPAAELNDGVDRSDPNFVKASLLVMGPGDELFSCAGHACLRLECPTFKLDNCFSYESESVRDKIWTFFRGKLKMGMFRVPTADYLKPFRESGRGVWQYELNLPPAAKQRLWKILDGKVAEGANLPYDYIKRGCALTVLENIRAALAPADLVPGPWPEKYGWNRRQIIADTVAPFPWTRVMLHAIGGTNGDVEVPRMQMVIMPRDLEAFLRAAKLGGHPLIVGDGVVLSEQKGVEPPDWTSALTPLRVAWGVVALAVGNLFIRGRGLDWFFLALQAAVGGLLSYLVFCSNLPGTDWNWLLVPFNPLPLAFWKWRRLWAGPYCLVLAVWSLFMLCTPHRYTDPAYALIGVAYTCFCAKIVLDSDLVLRLKGFFK